MEKRSITFFVANIPYRSGDEELRFVFEDVGLEVVRCEVVRDRVTEKSRGIGFVECKTDHAGTVIEKVTGQTIRGREVRLEVSVSRKTMRGQEHEDQDKVQTYRGRGPDDTGSPPSES